MMLVNDIPLKSFSFHGETSPKQLIGVSQDSTDGNIRQGTWVSEPGELELHFSWHETIYVLEGEANITNLVTQEQYLLSPGSMMIFEKGSHWMWHIHTELKKVWTVIM